MRRQLAMLTAAAPVLAAIPGAALAHAGHEAGRFMTGALHPLGGLDHVLAMVAVGLWAAQAGGRALWAMPAAFVGAMLAGGALGLAGLPLPAVEPMILASIVLLGALVALAVRLPMAAGLALLALFGLAHGHAHGAEGPASGLVAYAAGFALATLALHLAGIGLGVVLARAASSRAVRGVGTAAAAAGLWLGFGG